MDLVVEDENPSVTCSGVIVAAILLALLVIVFSFFELAAEDERVKAGFVDNSSFLFSTRSHHFSDPFVFYSYMPCYRVCQRFPSSIS